MKMALITDQHFGARNDSLVFVDHMEKFYNNVVFPFLIENKIDTVIDLGDTFDRRKFVNFNTLDSAKKMWFDRLRDSNIHLHSLVGNHTIYFRNTNELNTIDQLFRDYENITVYSEPTDVHFGDLKITMMPWMHNMNYADCVEHIQNTDSRVLFGHLDLTGFVMHQGIVNHHGMDSKPFEKFELVCSGHFHHKSRKGNIQYLGNPFELTWGDYNDARGFHLFDTETLDLKFFQNPYRMFYKVFYDDVGKTMDEVVEKDFTNYENTYVKVIVQNKSNPYWFDMMLDKLYKCNPANVSIVDDNNHLDEIDDKDIVNEAEDTITIMRKYVSSSNLNVDENQLNTLLTSLYDESQSLDIE